MLLASEATERSHEDQAIEELIHKLELDYPDVRHEGLSDLVHRVHAGFDDARIRDFIPLLVERNAREMLRSADIGRPI